MRDRHTPAGEKEEHGGSGGDFIDLSVASSQGFGVVVFMLLRCRVTGKRILVLDLEA